MNQEMKMKLRAMLIRDEGYSLKPYKDTVGKITIGIGRNLDDRGILPTEVDMMFEHDTDYFFNFLSSKYQWFNQIDPARQIALVNMCFMGTQKFQQFKRMIAALEKCDYDTAADELLHSAYHEQVGKRAERLADIIRHGVIAS